METPQDFELSRRGALQVLVGVVVAGVLAIAAANAGTLWGWYLACTVPEFYPPDFVLIDSVERVPGGGYRVEGRGGAESVFYTSEILVDPQPDGTTELRFRRTWYEAPGRCVGAFDLPPGTDLTRLVIVGGEDERAAVDLTDLPYPQWRRQR